MTSTILLRHADFSLLILFCPSSSIQARVRSEGWLDGKDHLRFSGAAGGYRRKRYLYQNSSPDDPKAGQGSVPEREPDPDVP